MSTLPLIGVGAPGSIGRLPLEVLSKILLLAAPPEDDVNEEGPRLSPEWVVLASVCRYWRNAINGNPMFWRCIDVGTRLEWLHLCLQRSAKLTVKILLRRTLDVKDPAVVSHILTPHRHRITIFIDFTPTCGKPLSLVSMQQLDYLTLEMNHPEGPDDHDVTCTIIHLLPAVGELTGTFPQLQHASLDGITVAIPVGLKFSSLLSLTLRNCSSYRPVAHPSRHILHILNACPSLQELTLFQSLASLMPSNMGVLPPIVALPELTYLETFEEPELISKLLSHLQIREGIVLELGAYVPTEPEMVPALPRILPSAREDYDRLTILRSIAHVEVDVSNEVKITAFVDKECENRVRLTVCEDDEQAYDYDPAPLWSVLMGLPSIFRTGAPIKTLALYGEMGTSSHWEETLEPYQGTLQALAIESIGDGPAALSLFQILGEREGRASMFCPNLQTIWINDVPVSPELMAAIRACVQRRRDEGCPLSELLLNMVDSTGPAKVIVSTFPEGSAMGLFNEEMKRYEKPICELHANIKIYDVHTSYRTATLNLEYTLQLEHREWTHISLVYIQDQLVHNSTVNRILELLQVLLRKALDIRWIAAHVDAICGLLHHIQPERRQRVSSVSAPLHAGPDCLRRLGEDGNVPDPQRT
ncbi:hypothetical protein C8Q74DRAFT_1363409 [Fomes fomentarius]|nr:hypothetical protein C8Q74DRAFT_1363409 [Fomes fomentarius]